uniref:Uncharacterized protein n=1 Tax=Siphoviridae sp. ctvhu9 TaxID=2827968 RepID=A0A8S5SKC1_9CAUD|nr:MAG TPA: hypothetical protein [Caudoviricetes sp.]DAF51002.1 MAG TPA: hypothetical protein [Siphoviridae sp. ctvhu9]DAM54714.1 MAG TPA: hypothetical protein [Caudoviricetes sp.]DAR06786.1 MAG TPA: hypothetical protein [Caudoviricetes sp.]DAU18813.1 MAG TPA: hypothetical protein [Caudoviricetes sp.]
MFKSFFFDNLFKFFVHSHTFYLLSTVKCYIL